MGNFSICFVYEVQNNNFPKNMHFEESWAIMQASNLIEATNKALIYGTKREETFANMHGELIHWKFFGIKHIEEVLVENGITEVCTFSTESNAIPLIKISAKVAETIR